MASSTAAVKPFTPLFHEKSVNMSKLLCKRTPFAREFNEALANDFYADIRCGLLHEARTKNGWRVWAKSSAGSIINPVERIVYRDNLQLALESFVDWYRQAPRADHLVQEVFVRKFDDLCE
jgi:hypothetical protein